MPAGAVGVWYRINAQDEIVFVDSAWDEIAAGLPAPDGRPGAVMGRPLWEFISDARTRRMYEQLLLRVRAGRTARFTLRCDSASCRRLMRMTIAAGEHGDVDFRTEPLEIIERTFMALLDPHSPRSDALLRACGWCNRIDVGCEEWCEIEEAVQRLRLFEAEAVPRLTHGMCEDCYVGFMDSVLLG